MDPPGYQQNSPRGAKLLVSSAGGALPLTLQSQLLELMAESLLVIQQPTTAATASKNCVEPLQRC